MFIQVIQGLTTDAGELKAALDRWETDLAPGADGWLGSTGGVTEDGTFIALARFESAEAARRNSRRPEQDAWWTEAAKLFGGPVTFHDCAEVIPLLGGGSDDAGFVQVIQGRLLDPERARQLLAEQERLLPALRPDLMGATIALHGDGDFTQAVYFTSEAAAREGERRQPPPEYRPAVEAVMAQFTDPTYLDLREPWLRSP